MANFPTSVFSPATKSNGQVVDASHINDLQAEVTAIEDGYLNGTARLNSSNSTLASLTVTGSVTLPPPDAIRVGLDIAQDITAGSTTSVNWTRHDFAINSSMHSTAVNPERLIPQSTGVYLAVLNCGQRSPSTYVDFIIRDSSNSVVGRVSNIGLAAAVQNDLVASGIKRFDVLGGYLRVEVDIRGSTNSLSTTTMAFSLVKL